MEILIPTDDGLTIAPDFENASAFRFLTIINGVIKEDAIRSVTNDDRDNFHFDLKDGCGSADSTGINNDSDQSTKDPLYRQIIITRGISPETEKNLQIINYEVFHTQETNIINALISYLKNFAIMESNYCCCP